MEDKEYLEQYENSVHVVLREFLLDKKMIDGIEPSAPDIEDKWECVARPYMQDGVREFNKYPLVSLGWMMFVGMAVAQMWDSDWEKCGQDEDLYLHIRDVRGFDCMDEYICEEILGLDAEAAAAISKIVGDAADIAYGTLQRTNFEPGTALAFHAYVRTLHQMYLSGAYTQLYRLGYKMKKI